MGGSDFQPRPATIYPVTVVDDPCLEAPFVNVYLNQLFQEEKSALDIRPLTLMSVLEIRRHLTSYSIGAVGLARVAG